MTPYIVVTIVAVGMLAAIPLVLHWERQDRERKRRS
jgi:hypothetical protein